MYPQTTTRINAILHPIPSLPRGISVQTPLSGDPRRSAAAFRPFSSLPSRNIPSFVTSAPAVGRRGRTGFVSCAAATAEEAFVKETVSAHDIVIFSKTYCPYCSTAKSVFKKLNKVPYVVELDTRDDGQDIQDALVTMVGRRTVPQVFIKGSHLGGSDDTVEAYQSGKLADLLGN